MSSSWPTSKFRSAIQSSNMAFLFISKKEVPEYLHKSDFYLALNDDDEDEEVQIPQNCFKPDNDVKNAADLTLLLSTLRFWGVSAIPESIIIYTVWHKPVEVIDAFVEFEQELRYVQFLRALCEGADKSIVTEEGEAWVTFLLRQKKISDLSTRVAKLCVYQYERYFGAVWNDITCILAAQAGSLDLLRFLHEHGCPWDEDCCVKAVEAKSLPVLRYAHEHGCPWDADTCTIAAERGNLDCLTYAHEHGCPWDARTCTVAAAKGNLECLRYAHENGCPWTSDAYCRAVYGGACEQYLRKQGCPEGEGSCYAAARAGDLTRLMALHKGGGVLNARICRAAVGKNQQPVLQYLHEQNCPWDENICEIAVQCYAMDCLHYLREHGARCDGRTLREAAARSCGEHMFRYLLNAGCGTDSACMSASSYGKGRLLLYALQKGCKGDRPSATYAARCGSLECLQYVHKQGEDWDESTCEAAAQPVGEMARNYVSRKDKLACLRYAHENGCRWDANTCTGAARSCDLECLQYAHQHGCPWNLDTVKAAVHTGSLHCLQYLHERGCEWPEPAWFSKLCKTVHNRRCLEYLAEHPGQRPAVCITLPTDCVGCVRPVPLPPVEADHAVPAPQEQHDAEDTGGTWQVVGRGGRVVKNRKGQNQETAALTDSSIAPPPASDSASTKPGSAVGTCGASMDKSLPCVSAAEELAACVCTDAVPATTFTKTTASAPMPIPIRIAATGAAVAATTAADAPTDEAWTLVAGGRRRRAAASRG